MRIQLLKRGYYSSIRHTLHIYSVDIILLHFLKNQIQFTPTLIVSVKFFRVCDSEHDAGKKSTDNNAQKGCIEGGISFFHLQSTFSTTTPALTRRSTPSVSLYSSR